MNKADTPEQREALKKALDESEAVCGAVREVRRIFYGLTEFEPAECTDYLERENRRLQETVADLLSFLQGILDNGFARHEIQEVISKYRATPDTHDSGMEEN